MSDPRGPSGSGDAPSRDAATPGTDRDERFRFVLEHLRAMIVELDTHGRTLHVSPTLHDILGYSPDEVIGRRVRDWVHPDDLGALAEVTRKLRETGALTTTDFRARHRLGHWVWLEMSAMSAYRTQDGETRVVTLSRDVSETKRAAQALRDSEDRSRAILENASDLIAEVDGEGRFLFVSPNSRSILGRSPEEIIGRTLAEVGVPENVHPDDIPALLEGFEQNVASARGGSGIQFRFRHPDSSWHVMESKGSTYRRSDGALRAVVISRDVTARAKVEAELRRSEERYAIVTRTSRDLITESDDQGRLLFVSSSCEQVFGYSPEELSGGVPFALVHPDDRERVLEITRIGLESRKPVAIEPYRVRQKSGGWAWCEGVGIAYEDTDGRLRIVGMTRDVTERVRAEQERRALEEQMQQAQKLEGLGVMAGGIAHDFNNLLTPILGDASLALMDLAPESPVRPYLEKIQKAAHRAAALTHQMLAYTGTGPLLVERLDLSKLVNEMARLLESAVSGRAPLVFELSRDLPAVEGDTAQLSQVVMNLITNACEAVGDGEGRIVVRSGVTDGSRVDRAHAMLTEDLVPGPYAYFEVADTGCGMNAATRARIFDPFFTTKFTGRGLGLAAVLGIVRGHRGAIEIHTEPGAGTRFRVILPAASPGPMARDAGEPEAEPWRGRGTLLVIDDDEGVRAFGEDTLRRAGLEVLSAADGQAGVELFRGRPDIRAVLLDRTMPTASGEEIYEELRRIRPDVPIILMSGYSEERATEHVSDGGLAGFLHKPFHPAALVDAVRRALEE